ncbi:hypothetical protein [Nocardioides sp. SYSU D00038]|uniref:hypothetical protein n=1 Tax=Nocardioides sp. SYSU D00038 TaxID=2812554 RepID=UPI00196761F5|nr:hypothetical protein [Nocardioides sp. SYSU D00038]
MRRTTRLAVLAAASCLALTGCGVAGTDFRPGVAAEVGDSTISTDHVDEVAAGYCKAITDQLVEGSQKIPNGLLRGGIAGQLALRAATEQLAEERDVEPGQAFRDKVAQTEAATADLAEAERDAVLEVETAGTYIVEVLTEIGAEDAAAGATSEEKLAAGQEALVAWLADHEVALDPRYGVSIASGQPTSADTGLSVAVSETATQGSSDNPEPSYGESLPDNQRCG